MARKVFLSILGTSFYHPCRYIQGDYESSEVTFIQHAALEYLSRQTPWEEKDKIVIALTSQAKTCNWNASIRTRYDVINQQEKPYTGLEKVFQEQGWNAWLHLVDIPNGETEQEIWKIFTDIYEVLEEGDELYVDITHSFRYLPMVLLVLCNYAQFLKGVTVKSILYGNYEARNKETNQAPMLDLLPISLLQEWTFATADFIKNGRTDELMQLSQQDIRRIKRDEADKRTGANQLSNAINRMHDFFSNLQLCQGKTIAQGLNLQTPLMENSDDITDLIPPLTPILAKVEDTISTFHFQNEHENILAAAQWCIEKHLYQQAVTLLREGILTYVVHSIGENIYDKDLREKISGYMKIISSPNEKDWSEFSPALLKTLNAYEFPQEFIGQFNSLRERRNQMNHAAFTDNPANNKSLLSSIQKTCNFFTEFIQKHPCLTKRAESVPSTPSKLLINLSNHPYATWGDTQKEAAAIYGTCQDLPFPAIEALTDEQQIQSLIKEYVQKISSYQTQYEITVHIMGEMTFCFGLVHVLMKKGIPCIASCANRNVVEDEKAKTSFFSFKRFREYHF